MPIYMEISPLHRLVTIVAQGTISGDEVRGTAQELADARVRRFAKIVEVASASLVAERARASSRPGSWCTKPTPRRGR
ncbi:MAG: hypothetical protein HYZ40_13620 [Rhodospirillales bacterium]|nr:hypothetical protein [Rhodospirillales bacterium]